MPTGPRSNPTFSCSPPRASRLFGAAKNGNARRGTLIEPRPHPKGESAPERCVISALTRTSLPERLAFEGGIRGIFVVFGHLRRGAEALHALTTPRGRFARVTPL